MDTQTVDSIQHSDAHEEQALIIDLDDDVDLFTEDSKVARLRSMVIA